MLLIIANHLHSWGYCPDYADLETEVQGGL